jgi:glycosyltransferase involved in cell wall biosynthesis
VHSRGLVETVVRPPAKCGQAEDTEANSANLEPKLDAHRIQQPLARIDAACAANGGARTLFINGKFTAQHTTGVQRMAWNLLDALDEHLAASPSSDARPAVLLVPKGVATPTYRHIETQELGGPAMPLHLWEQCMLPLAARGGLLLNLSGSAPLLGHRQVCFLHDAAVFDRPDAYSATFRLWYRTLFWLLARRRVTLLTVSAFSQRRLAERLGVVTSRIGIVPGGGEHLVRVTPDASVLARLGLEPGRYLMAVGSANPNKNLDALKTAFHGLSPGRGIKLVLVGSADPRVFANRPDTSDDCKMAGVVQAGRLDDGQLKALYQHAIGLVFPSLYEGFGLPPLEAMSCGCPVAASNSAAIPEICGDAALYFDPGSIEQIAAAMQRLLDDEPLREHLRSAGAERLQHFRWDLSASSLQSHLQSALADSQVTP